MIFEERTRGKTREKERSPNAPRHRYRSLPAGWFDTLTSRIISSKMSQLHSVSVSGRELAGPYLNTCQNEELAVTELGSGSRRLSVFPMQLFSPDGRSLISSDHLNGMASLVFRTGGKHWLVVVSRLRGKSIPPRRAAEKTLRPGNNFYGTARATADLTNAAAPQICRPTLKVARPAAEL